MQPQQGKGECPWQGRRPRKAEFAEVSEVSNAFFLKATQGARGASRLCGVGCQRKLRTTNRRGWEYSLAGDMLAIWG